MRRDWDGIVERPSSLRLCWALLSFFSGFLRTRRLPAPWTHDPIRQATWNPSMKIYFFYLFILGLLIPPSIFLLYHTFKSNLLVINMVFTRVPVCHLLMPPFAISWNLMAPASLDLASRKLEHFHSPTLPDVRILGSWFVELNMPSGIPTLRGPESLSC